MQNVKLYFGLWMGIKDGPNHSKMKHPGEIIREELDKRGWTQADLARILNRPLPTVNEIIVGKRAIMPEMAVALGAALGTSPEQWMKLESDYRLSLVRGSDVDGVSRRVRLFDVAPVKEMERRGWIKHTDSIEELERELCRFFNVETIEQEPQITVATKRSISTEPLNPAQRAWCFRARQLAQTVHAENFREELLPHCETRLRELAAFKDEACNIPKVLAGFGIRFVVVEPLAASKIDGAAFWLSPEMPVIALAIRYDRIGSFWFSLAHEFAHIKNGDASIDSELVGESAMPTEAKTDIERRADEQAANLLIPAEKLQSFITRVSPLYSKTRINQFAHVMKIHPGIVVGQLQHRGEISWRANREMLASVRSLVTSTALTDGWGRILKPNVI
jgi:HTH-type transcriptional regulator/antitoxin HigA